MSTQKNAIGEKVYRAIADLMAVGASPTRKTIAESSGVKLSAVDWHLRVLRDLGRIHSPANAIWNVVHQEHEDRAVSATHLPGGRFKLEIGDACIEMSLREGRMVAMATAGIAVAFGT
jgi:hypothetical protein